jgi:ABC-type glycerol-3-phosphate transport system substrate-binding protein
VRRSIARTGRFGYLFLPVFLLLVACDLIQPQSVVEVTPSPAATNAPLTVEPQVTSELPGPSQQARPVSPLRLWLPPEIGNRTEAGSQELASQIRAFQSANPDLEIVVEQKPVDGQGGLINYLQTGGDVAPAIMPDVVAVPTSALADTRLRELFAPLELLIDPILIEGAYPGPVGQVIDGETILGYPFATAGLTHLVYQTDVITGTIPVSWPVFISDTNHTMVFPADSREGAILGLQFYLAEGGRLVDEAGQPALEVEPLSRALAMIGLRKDNLLQSHQLKTLDEAWQYHQLGLSDFVWARSEFLLDRQASDSTLAAEQGYSPTPGVSGSLIPLTTSWAWAITTQDPARQALAAELIMFLTTPENLANWSARSHILPARRDAMALLAAQDPYYQFASLESERAQAMPVSETSRLLDVMGDAVFQVLTTDTPPLVIAEQAIAALRQ